MAEVFGPWVLKNEPAFGPGVRERFASAMALTSAEIEAARSRRAEITAAIESALDGGVIMLPTAPGPAPLLTLSGDGMEAYRNRALTLLCISGHTGLPQVTLPLSTGRRLPVGLSLIGPRGSDTALIAAAIAVSGALS